VEDVNLPEGQQELALDGITHDRLGAHHTGTDAAPTFTGCKVEFRGGSDSAFAPRETT